MCENRWGTGNEDGGIQLDFRVWEVVQCPTGAKYIGYKLVIKLLVSKYLINGNVSYFFEPRGALKKIKTLWSLNGESLGNFVWNAFFPCEGKYWCDDIFLDKPCR